jgi:hypothetical protein
MAMSRAWRIRVETRFCLSREVEKEVVWAGRGDGEVRLVKRPEVLMIWACIKL